MQWTTKIFKPTGLQYCWIWLHNMYWEFRGLRWISCCCHYRKW